MSVDEGGISPGRIGEDSGTDEAGQPSEFVDVVDAAEVGEVDEADADGWFDAHRNRDG